MVHPDGRRETTSEEKFGEEKFGGLLENSGEREDRLMALGGGRRKRRSKY